jgi:predicted heme/steroid binding protein
MGGHPDHSQASMVFDGRYKSVFYHGHDLAELFDHENDPHEFDNLWSQPDHEALKLAQMRLHMQTMMSTVDLGPPRFVNY